MRADSFKNQFVERRVVLGRAVAATLIVALAFAALLARLVYLQVSNHSHYQTLSEENRINLVPIPPTRGTIYDRNGVVLAENIPSFTLEIVPERVADMAQTLDDLGRILPLSVEEIERFNHLRKRKRRFEKVPLKTNLSEEEIAKIAVERHRFPGVDITVSLSRYYPLSELTSHVVGYLGRISEKDLESIDASDYSGTTHIGKIGLEKSYEEQLLGTVGVQQVEINANGRIVRVLETQPPEAGADLHLFLDARLQQMATRALGEHTGSVVAIEPATGGVLALVSNPGYDPNPFVDGISHSAYALLRDDPKVPLYNRAIQGRYPPGSTVKPFIALGGLELGTVTASQSIYCPGSFKLKGSRRIFRDWKKSGHGHMNVDAAVTQSCDVYFYDLANHMGIDKFHDFLSLFSFGQRTGIDLPLESAATLPSRDWKRARYGQPWLPGDTINAGIGQGYFLATPLQLAYATAVFAADGLRTQPRVVEYVGSEPTLADGAPLERLPHENEANWTKIAESMNHVVEHGTARRIRNDNYRIAGKTGTAQVITMKQHEVYDATKLEKEKHDHALFVAYAPLEDPKIAIAVIAENGGHGGATAAPIAKQVMDYYLGEILGMFPLEPVEPAQPQEGADEATADAASAQEVGD